jgi:hypothetical protein
MNLRNSSKLLTHLGICLATFQPLKKIYLHPEEFDKLLHADVSSLN